MIKLFIPTYKSAKTGRFRILADELLITFAIFIEFSGVFIRKNLNFIWMEIKYRSNVYRYNKSIMFLLKKISYLNNFKYYFYNFIN